MYAYIQMSMLTLIVHQELNNRNIYILRKDGGKF